MGCRLVCRFVSSRSKYGRKLLRCALYGVAGWLKSAVAAMPALLPALEEQQIGCWYNPMQGSLQLIPPQGTAELYKQLYDQAVALGGAGNWYYMDSYGFAPETETPIVVQFKAAV